MVASKRAPELFALLTEILQLPVAWPMSDYGNFGSGGVALGNVNLEILKATTPTAEAVFLGFALEPEPLRSSLPELEARKIAHGRPAPFRSTPPAGWFKLLWTTVALPEFSNDALQIFLCEYASDTGARRAALLEQLRSRAGGPLSVLSVREIVCSAADLNRTEARWRKLLQPHHSYIDGAWRIGTGPAIVVQAAGSDRIQEVVIQVKSLSQARAFLQQHDLLGSEHASALTLSSPLLQGLTITLVEQR